MAKFVMDAPFSQALSEGSLPTVTHGAHQPAKGGVTDTTHSPESQDSTSSAQSPDSAETHDEPLRALVVEDDPTFRLVLKSVLSQRGLEAVACEDADTALEAFRRQPFHIALLDNYLPDMKGVELTRQIREMPRGREAMIILVTGDERMETAEAALSAGADDYLSKDASPGYFSIRLAIAERTIREAAGRRKALADATRNPLADSLTGLASRALLLDRIQGGIHRTDRQEGYLFGVLHLDLDGFRRVVQRLGKEPSDQVLVEVGRRLEASLRLVDTPAHLAADEFAVFLDDLQDGSDVARITDRIHQTFAEPFRVGGETVFLSACMGIALGDAHYRNAEEVFRDASKALRRAKAEGSGSVRIFDPVVHERASARVRMEEDIRTALETDAMALHYQPILSLASPRVVGLEALMRWPRKNGGFVPAQEFIPIAEQSSLVTHMGWWTLERACRQLAEWHDRLGGDPPVAVNVNVPGRQFSQPELVPSVFKILEETGLSGEHLHLEITETSAMENLEWSVSTLRELKAAGVRIHVDDFGTGYSSLSYLHRLPVDSLKVDRSFVSGITESPENLAIVRTVVDLARNLGLSTVAEGIETEEQLRILKELGCEFGQGWLFSRALDGFHVEKILRDPGEILGPAERGH